MFGPICIRFSYGVSCDRHSEVANTYIGMKKLPWTLPWLVYCPRSQVNRGWVIVGLAGPHSCVWTQSIRLVPPVGQNVNLLYFILAVYVSDLLCIYIKMNCHLTDVKTSNLLLINILHCMLLVIDRLQIKQGATWDGHKWHKVFLNPYDVCEHKNSGELAWPAAFG